MVISKIFVAIFVGVILTASLSGCGVKGNLSHPDSSIVAKE